MSRKLAIYDVYRGDEYLFSGTAKEFSLVTGLKIDTVYWFATKQRMRRVEKSKKPRGYILLRQDDLDGEF